MESGAPTTAQTSNGRIPLWFAASENNLNVVMYLLKQAHDAYLLLDDRKVNEPEEYLSSKFILKVISYHFSLFIISWRVERSLQMHRQKNLYWNHQPRWMCQQNCLQFTESFPLRYK